MPINNDFLSPKCQNRAIVHRDTHRIFATTSAMIITKTAGNIQHQRQTITISNRRMKILHNKNAAVIQDISKTIETTSAASPFNTTKRTRSTNPRFDFLVLAAALLLSIVTMTTHALPNHNDLGRVPPMGWNSWNAYFCNVTENSIKEATQELIRLGLQEVGYKYVNMDDCWMSHERHNETGEYQANPITFPSGIPSLVQYVHDHGFLFGLYTSAGTKTCAGYPGSLYHEQVDANTFAKWQVDYLKYDNCYNDNIPSFFRYNTMRNALLQTERPIFFSLCQWGLEHSWQWAPSVGHAWRTTNDIFPTWISIVNNFWQNQQHLEQVAGKYNRAWADPDLLEIGNGGNQLTLAEQKTHFGLWVMVKAPLILSTNLTNLSPELLDIIKNKRLIDLNQNAHYPPARCYVGCQPNRDNSTLYSILATSNILDDSFSVSEEGSNVTIAVMVNWSKDITLKNVVIYGHEFGLVPLPSRHQVVVVTDLWTGETIATMITSGIVPLTIPVLKPHDSIIYRFELIPANNDHLEKVRQSNEIVPRGQQLGESLQASSWR